MRWLLSFLLFLALAPLPAAGSAPVRVVASIEPLSMMLREVFGDQVEVATLLQPGQTPHNLSFTPGQMRMVRNADLVVWLGGEAEPQTAGLLRRRDGATLALLAQQGIHVRKTDNGNGGASDGHHHGSAVDPHLWLYPDNIRKLAAALPSRHEALRMDAGEVNERVEAFREVLAEREHELDEKLAPIRDKAYISYHDPWAYFAAAFKMRRATIVSHNLDVEPGTREFTRLAARVREEGVACILAEPEGRRSLLRRLCPECRLVEMDPLGRDLAGGTYTALLGELAERYRACLAPDQN